MVSHEGRKQPARAIGYRPPLKRLSAYRQRQGSGHTRGDGVWESKRESEVVRVKACGRQRTQVRVRQERVQVEVGSAWVGA